MPDNNGQPVASSLPSGYRASGVLLHLTSLPSPYGIGDLGPSAFAWIDRMVEWGQSWWQILPLGPTGPGDSPYDSLSTFAGNTLLLSPDRIIEEGLIEPAACPRQSFPDNMVDYDGVTVFKQRLVEMAWSNFQMGAPPRLQSDFQTFCERQSWWLDDYALFRALKDHYAAGHYLDLPDELVQRDQAALARSRQSLADEIDRCRFGQFLFARQWQALKQYAAQHGVGLIGDLPIFVSPDSADAWAHPEMFLLDERQRPIVVAGVPPDYFSPTGQLWGNPVYDWDALRRDDYRWWIERVQALLTRVDLIRLDHFRAFAAAWHVPADATTAVSGAWVRGPGAEFFQCLQRALGRLPLVAEDLGSITDDVRELRDQFHLPGMSVLQFAFDGDPKNPFLPSNFVTNTVAYTGTHDNNTTRGWYESLQEGQRQGVWRSLQRPAVSSNEVAWEFVRLIWSSKAALAIAPLQDLLSLGAEAKMNVPGLAEGNWTWRCTEEMLVDTALQQIRHVTEQSDRWREPIPVTGNSAS